MSPLLIVLLLVGLGITAVLTTVAYRNWMGTAVAKPSPPASPVAPAAAPPAAVVAVTTTTTTTSWSWKDFWKERWFTFAVGIVLLHLILFTLPGGIYKFLCRMPIFWIGHLVLFLLVLFSEKDSAWQKWIKENFPKIILRAWLAAFVIAILVAGYKSLPDWFASPNILPAPASDSTFVLTVRPDQPMAVTVPEMWRWDLKDPMPTSRWNHDGKRVGKDRIETFWVESPDSVAVLHVRVSRCATIAQCAW